MSTLILFVFSITLISLFIFSSVYAAIPADVLRVYPTLGSITGTVNASVTKTISMLGASQLNLVIVASGGMTKFNSTNLVISASQDNSTFLTIDTLALGNTSATLGKTYSDGNKGTAIAINAASFPFVKMATSHGINGVTEKLYWSATP